MKLRIFAALVILFATIGTSFSQDKVESEIEKSYSQMVVSVDKFAPGVGTQAHDSGGAGGACAKKVKKCDKMTCNPFTGICKSVCYTYCDD